MSSSFNFLQVNDIQGYPSLVCEGCVNMLRTCYDFVMMCNQTQVELEDCYNRTLEKAKAELDSTKTDVAELTIEDHVIKEEILNDIHDIEEVVADIQSTRYKTKKENNFKMKEVVLSDNDDSCGAFVGNSELTNKPDVKTSKNAGPHPCQFCEKQYVFKNSLRTHVKKHHKDLLIHKCNYCPKTYATKSELNNHLGLEHRNLEVLCPYCNLSLKVQALDDHCNEFHKLKVRFSPAKKLLVKEEVEKECLCQTCGEVFSTKKAHQTHVRQHKKEKEKKMGDEPKPSTVKKVFNEFTDNKPKSFHCDLCGKSFRGKDTLQRHVRTHTGEKNYICEICSKGFYTKSEINRHVRYHRKHYRYICSICAKGFVDKTRFRHHMMAHKNVRPHKCPICNKEFILRGKMKIHLARRHSAIIEDPNARVKGHTDPETYIPLDDLLKC